METIKFYEGKYYPLSNFSSHRVIFEDQEFATCVHAYQVAKFQDTIMKEKIRNAPSAFLAREYGQTRVGQVENWDDKKVEVMKKVMRAKLEQHEDVRQALLSTGNAFIEKNYPDDYYWGTGADGSGKNMMGKIWMELRDEII